MAKINKIINVKVEGVGKIKQLEDSLKKLRKQQRDIKKDMKDGANANKEQTKEYKNSENAIKGQSKALRETKKAMLDANNTTRKGTKLQNSMAMGVLKGAAAFTILVTAFRRVSQALVSVISVYTEFEFTMAKVKAVSGANADEFKRLSDAAEELGRSTFFTASEVANLQLNLSKLGFSVVEIEQATQGVINLSIATGSDLARSATVAGNAIRGFQLDASETTRVVDIMAVAFTSSALDIEKWQTSMTKVAPIAAMAGFSIEEVTAVMSKLSDTGIEASIAGTSLRNIFLKMQDPTSDLTKKVGHTITNLDDMLLYFKDLQEAGTDLGDVLTFMDVRQVAAFGTMLNGADDIKALRDQLLEAEGAGAEMAGTIGDTLKGSIFRVKSALQGVSIALVKQFGPAMKRTLEQFARWLNRMVDSEEKLEKFWKGVKTATKLLLAFAIGLPIVRRAIKFFAAETVGAAGSMTILGGAVTGLKFALRGLKIAIASTGIGLLIVALGELAAGFFFAETEGERLNGLINEQGKVISQLVDKKRDLAKIENDVINATTKEITQVDRLTKAFKNAESPLETRVKILDKLKGISKEHFGELKIGMKNYENLDQAAADYKTTLVELAQVEAGKAALIGIEGQIARLDAEIEVYRNNTDAMWEFGADFVTDKNASAEEIIEIIRRLDGGDALGVYGYETEKQVQDLISSVESFEKLKISVPELEEAKELRDAIVKNIGKIDVSALLDLGGEGSCADDEMWNGSRCVKKSTKAKYTMAEKVTEQEADVPSIDDQVKYNIAMLEAKGRGILAFRNQEKTTQEEKDTADIAYHKNELALDKARYAQELNDLTLALAKNKILLQDYDAFNLLSTEEQNIQLNNLDIKFQNDKKNAAINNNIDLEAIENQIAKEDLEAKKLTLDQKLAILDDQYKTDQINLEEALVNKEITEIEHQQFMLHLESIYLLNKQGLYAGYADELKDINNDIKNNTIESTEAQMEAMNSYISSVGDLGQQMQDLAGDEEKLSGLRKVGVAITTAASTAEKILAIATTITTLATKKKTITEAIDVSMTGAVVTANMTKTASNLTTAASGFIATIASAAKSLKFPWNIAAIALTGAALFGMVKKIKGSFGGGGGDLPSDSGGGNPSSSSRGGGQMSLMTFGGQHTTVGAVDGYAQGGMVHGNSHAQGGEKFSVGGRVVELEGGEAVINKRSTSMFRSQLSAMNYAGGGVSFADGGVTNVPSFAQTQFQVDGQRGIQGAMSQRSKVVVVEADITKSQNRVSAIEAEASF